MFERFFVNDDGTLLDRTIEWSNPYTSTGAWDCKSYLYVSSYLPFDHKYIDITTANDQAGTLTVEIWYNSQWVDAVDILDDTKSSGKSFAKSGIISFHPDKLKGWDIEDDTDNITELSTKSIYNVYWMRFGIGASSDSACVINHIGHKFCDDYELYAYYPMLNNSAIKTQFKAGKTDWVDQQISASKNIINDLINRNVIKSKDQIFNSKNLVAPCVHKTAELIFAGMGSAFRDDKAEAKRSYDESMIGSVFNVDVTQDGTQDRIECNIDYTMMSR